MEPAAPYRKARQAQPKGEASPAGLPEPVPSAAVPGPFRSWRRCSLRHGGSSREAVPQRLPSAAASHRRAPRAAAGPVPRAGRHRGDVPPARHRPRRPPNGRPRARGPRVGTHGAGERGGARPRAGPLEPAGGPSARPGTPSGSRG